MPTPSDRRRAAQEARVRIAAAAAARDRRRRIVAGAGVAVALASLVGLLAVRTARGGGSTSQVAPGVRSFSIPSPEHVTGAVAYEQSPPVGGDHAAVWQNCGAYDDPVPNEQAVHSMEHGAVWLTYGADVKGVDLEVIEAFAQQPYVVASPWPAALPGRVVASAWGKQLVLATVDAPKIEAFLKAHRQSDDAPEPGAPCSGGAGTPV